MRVLAYLASYPLSSPCPVRLKDRLQAGTCRQRRYSARSSSACRQEPPLPLSTFKMSLPSRRGICFLNVHATSVCTFSLYRPVPVLRGSSVLDCPFSWANTTHPHLCPFHQIIFESRSQERRLEVNDMRMLWWMFRVTKIRPESNMWEDQWKWHQWQRWCQRKG